MTLGEKILQLRRENHLSQEKLAEKLNVSRQAVSKWELGESTPDTEKIVQLSKMFKVSTDYLLLEELNNREEFSNDEKMNHAVLEKGNPQKALFITTTGINVIGLLMSIAGFLTWQTIFAVSIGMVIQIIAVIIFEVGIIRSITDKRDKMLRRKFYMLNVWFLLFIPVLFFIEIIVRLVPFPISFELNLLVNIITYFMLCGNITILLIRRKSTID